MGKQVSVYIRESDAEVWQRAERYAKARRIPMSALVMTALERFLEKQGNVDNKTASP